MGIRVGEALGRIVRSLELLEKLAAEAIAEDDAGLTEPLDPDSL